MTIYTEQTTEALDRRDPVPVRRAHDLTGWARVLGEGIRQAEEARA